MRNVLLVLSSVICGGLLATLLTLYATRKRPEEVPAAADPSSESIEDLQKRKLRAEIQELVRPSHRKPAVILASASAVAALLGVGAQGWLTRINIAQARLDQSRAEVLRDSAEAAVQGLRTDSVRLAQQNQSLEATAQQIILGLQAQQDSLKQKARAAGVVLASTSPPPSGGAGLDRAFEQLYSDQPAVRLRAYDALTTTFGRDTTLVPKLLAFARTRTENLNGTYNALVLLSHLDPSRLRPHVDEIRAFTAEVRSPQNPRISERADVLDNRLPRGR